MTYNPWQGSVGTDPSIEWQVAPCGGIITLQLSSATSGSTWSLTRYVSGVSGLTNPYVLVSGAATSVWVDDGDGLQAPLDPATLYAYELVTQTGSITTSGISPAASITLQDDKTTKTLFRALQAAVQNLVLPLGFKRRPSVVQAMPIGVAPTLPLISLNLSLIQQGDVPVGQTQDYDYQNNQYVVGGLSLRHYTVAIATSNVDEREFYRDLIVSLFNGLLGTLFQQIGLNTRHRWQCSQTQVSSRESQPGFYVSEILLELTGPFSTLVSTNYGVIAEVVPAASGTPGFGGV